MQSGAACGLVAKSIETCGSVRLSSLGTSMVPAIQPGDLLTIEPATLSELSVGDVVVYTFEDTMIVHRLVRTFSDPENPHLITRGDRSLRDDQPVHVTRLLGRVALIERGKRRVTLSPLSKWPRRVLCAVLQRSDRATSLFLRMNQLRSAFSAKGST